MTTPRVDQVNIVVGDVVGATRFLADLGVELPETAPGWEAHHRSLPSASTAQAAHVTAEPAFDVDLDSAEFARWWGGLDSSFNGVVVNLRVDPRGEVDQLHERALALGARSLHAPHDAFWGSRHAVVRGPGPLVVGFMSVPDESRRSSPPDPATLA